MRAHQMEGITIINIIEVESLDFMPGLIDASIGGQIGDTIVEGVVQAKAVPPAAVPEAITMRQARLALLGAGLLGTVNNAIAAMPGEAGEAARIEWEYSGEVQRHKALVASMTAALSLTESQVDALFLLAASL